MKSQFQVCSVKLPLSDYKIIMPVLHAQGITFSGFVRSLVSKYLSDFQNGKDLSFYSNIPSPEVFNGQD